MRRAVTLPHPPDFHIEVVADHSPPGGGFLRYVSRDLVTVDPKGKRSEPLRYDEVDRKALDAVVIVPHFVEELASLPVRFVVLRSALRPPIALRDAERSPQAERRNRNLWEVPAGLVEEAERTPAGLVEAAARELYEEAGFRVEVDRVEPLGPSAFPCPGVIAERHFFFHVEVDPATQQTPELDGSILEEAGELIALPLSAALSAVRGGKLEDAKTELALRRLEEHLMRVGAVQ